MYGELLNPGGVITGEPVKYTFKSNDAETEPKKKTDGNFLFSNLIM